MKKAGLLLVLIMSVVMLPSCNNSNNNGKDREVTLYAMNDEGVAKSIIRLSEGSEIKSIRYHKDSMYILDSSIGCIYKLGNGNNLSVFNLPKIIWVFLIIFIIAIVLIIVMKFKEKKGQ